MYTSLWTVVTCNDPYCDNGTTQTEQSLAYSLLSNGDVFTTMGGQQPLLQYCPLSNQVYPSGQQNPVGDQPYDPGIWTYNGVTQSGNLYVFDNGFNNVFAGNPSDPAGLYISPSTQYEYQNVGPSFDFFADLNQKTVNNGSMYILANCNEP